MDISIINWLNSYSSLITAIATLVLAIITGYYAWQNRKYVKLIEMDRKDRKRKNLKEIISEVLEPLQKELKLLASIDFYGYKIPEFRVWQSLKFEKPSLIYAVPDDLRRRIEAFLEEYEEYFKCHYKLIEIIQIITKKIINMYDIGEECKNGGKCECNYIDIHFPELVGKPILPHSTSLFYFIFRDKIDEFFKRYRNHGIEYAQIRFNCVSGISKFTIAKNWKIDEIVKLLNYIKKEFDKNLEAQKILNFQRKIRSDANKLRDEILILIKTWSKELVE